LQRGFITLLLIVKFYLLLVVHLCKFAAQLHHIRPEST